MNEQMVEEKNPFISKEDYERIMTQGKKEDMERLLEFEIIKFKESKKREGTIKVKNEYVKVINPGVEDNVEEEQEEIEEDIAELFTDREGIPYATIKTNNHLENWQIRSRQLN